MKDDILVTLADKNFITQAKQLFSSAYWNAGWDGDYLLLAHEDVDDKDLEWFESKGILVQKCRTLSEKGWGDWPPTLLDKFYLFTPPFKQWKHILFIESDIIIRSSLKNLTRISGFGAVKTIGTGLKYFIGAPLLETPDFHGRFNDHDLDKPTFNPGVMAFSSDIIQGGTFQGLMGLFERYGQNMLNVEETILNLYFRKQWKKMPFIYNMWITQILAHKKNISMPVGCLHFIGMPSRYFSREESKPWHPKNPFHKDWLRSLQKAEEMDLRRVPRGLAPTVIIQKYYSAKYAVLIGLIRYSPRVRSFFGRHFAKYNPFAVFDRCLGQIGLFIKKRDPELYSRLKKTLYG